MTAQQDGEGQRVALRRASCPDALLFVDVTVSQYWAAEAFTCVAPRTFFNPTNNQAMGWSIPAALGAQRAHPLNEQVRLRDRILIAAEELIRAAHHPVRFGARPVRVELAVSAHATAPTADTRPASVAGEAPRAAVRRLHAQRRRLLSTAIAGLLVVCGLIAVRVVILGGGFGGLVAAQKLKRAPVEVTLIDRRNFHLFQPLLYQVATGSLSPGEIAAPLRGVLSRQKNTRVLLGEAVDVDPEAKRVILRDGAAFEYDSLIVATGSQTSYYGNDSWREWAPSLKSVEEATAIRHKILYAFECAERAATPEEARAWLTFVIVGAGATGLELSGALAEIARETLRHDFRKINPRDWARSRRICLPRPRSWSLGSAWKSSRASW